MTLTLNQSSCIWRIDNQIDVKQKKSKSVRYWADCIVLPFDHTHDLDLVGKFEIALFV